MLYSPDVGGDYESSFMVNVLHCPFMSVTCTQYSMCSVNLEKQMELDTEHGNR